MKQSLNYDTLAYQIGMRPALQHRDMSDLPLPQVVKSVVALMASDNLYEYAGIAGKDESKEGSPEVDAVVFYMLNHASTLVRQRAHVYEPLGDYLKILEAYHVELAARASRMFAYLLLICTRESRHEKNNYASTSLCTTKFGYEPMKLLNVIKNQSSLGAAQAFMDNPPNMTLGKYTSFLRSSFYDGNYSNSYGGKAWGAVADVLEAFAHGKITAEMMMDTAFTLCHNNGPIFNKGMLFKSYGSEIYKILDVQRSGQIPQLVASGQVGVSSDKTVKTYYNICSAILGKEFDGHVDWFLVEELGALKTYAGQKAAQIAKYGYPSKFKAKKEMEAAANEVKAKQALHKLKSQVEIMPGLYITKVERASV